MKLPGTFVSGFWTSLLFQASLQEPAVLHAVLALSSVHKRGTIHTVDVRNAADLLPEKEQFALQHYVKAINNLQSHISIKDRASFRVALIACVVFIYLESLRGHFETAQIHLQNGLKILGEAQMLSDGIEGIAHSNTHYDLADDWIVEAFSRLQLQVELFQHNHQHTSVFLQTAGSEPTSAVFNSINEAWKHLERLLNRIFRLTDQSRQQASHDYVSSRYSSVLLEQQQRIRAELTWWFNRYEAFEKATNGRGSEEEEKCYQLLYVYHTMASIMAATSLQPSDESVFDCHMDLFVLLISQLASLAKIGVITDPFNVRPAKVEDMSRSIVDMGWIPPLYYVAVKCRVHRIRLHAIKFLESTFHREGIWDARIAACVARKVMVLEERDFYKGVDTADDFPLLSSPCLPDVSLPTLPEYYRIRDVEIVLQGAPMDNVLLYCKQRKEGIDRRVLLSEHNLHLERWVDRTHR